MAKAVSGVSVAGLRMQVQPAASAGRDLARCHRRREIPRRDQHGDADRLVLDEDAVGAARRDADIAVDADRLFGIPAEELGGIGHLAPRVRERLAVFQRDQPCEAVEPRLISSKALRRISARGARRRRGPAGAPRPAAASTAAMRVFHGGIGDLGENGLRSRDRSPRCVAGRRGVPPSPADDRDLAERAPAGFAMRASGDRIGHADISSG